MTGRRVAAAVSIGLMLSGCASSTAVLGRHVEVRQTNGDAKHPVQGELIAVGPEAMWLAGEKDVRSIPRSEVQDVRVRRHGTTKGKAMSWVVLGALISGAVLGFACSTVEGANDCTKIALPVALTWGVIGIPSAVSLGKSSELHVDPADWEALRAHARFPQGLPEGVDPASLAAKKSPRPASR